MPAAKSRPSSIIAAATARTSAAAGLLICSWTRSDRTRLFTLAAAEPALIRAGNPVLDAAADVAWRLAESAVSAEEEAACMESLRVADEANLEIVRHHFDTPVNLSEFGRLVGVLTLLFS